MVIRFRYGSDSIPTPDYCDVSPEPTLFNGKYYYKAVDTGCTVQYLNYYVWYSTGGTYPYPNQWVLAPLNSTDPLDYSAYLPTSESEDYPIGNDWTTDVVPDYFITDSEEVPDPACCTKIAATIETYLKYAEAVGLTPPAAVP